jgi:beta-mannosidase
MTIDLNGKWTLRWYDGERGPRDLKMLESEFDQRRAIPATVPGSVHLDLMKAGWIKDPNDGLNALECRWVEERFWYYRRTFTARSLRRGQKAFLVFEGLDLAATVSLNGKEIGTHANAFYPCRMDVTASLVKGTNVVVVKLDSGIFHAMDRSADGYNVNMSSRLTKRPWLRKAQFSSNWDWSPRLLNVGIHGDVRLEIVESFRFDQTTVLTEVSEDYSTGTVTARMNLEGFEEKPIKAVMRVEVVEVGVSARTDVEIKKGACRVEAKVVVPGPRMWWPIGHGTPFRYTVKATLTPVRGEKVEAFRKVGFRRVRVNQDPHPEKGRYFTIEVNGRPIFCKGGNFVPADMIPARIDRKRYRVLIDRAIESNSNFMRVWGGGLYEHDDFYEECDRRGLLVWQEFIFACAKYPTTDEKFLADVKREAQYQIRRLAHHPSLVVWCGNNEMEQGNYHWGYDKGVAHPDYALFHMVLPRLLKENDGTRYYQASSPMSPDLQDPLLNEVGDQHPWSIGFTNNDFREYRKMVCRFPNEGGILGPNSLPTVLRCLPAGQRKVGSLAWETHDNSVSYWGNGYHQDKMLGQWLGLDTSKLSIEEYVYWGGVIQGEGLTDYIRNFHRRMFSSASAIFWMYNDCWPTVRSWTTVDYDLRRTPSFHPVRRAFAPVNVVVVAEEGAKEVVVYGVNETREPVAATLRYGVFRLAGRYPLDRRQEVVLAPNASTRLAAFPRRLWTKPNASAAFAVLTSGKEIIARDRLILPFFKEMRWPRANVRVACRDGNATFTSSTFAWRVCLDLDGEKKLADNFFDVYPGQPHTIPWPFRTPPKVLYVGNLRK